MAKLGMRGIVEAKVTMEITEAEAGALDALVGYGFEPFKKVFYEKLGAAYMEPYEAGLKSLFESVRGGEAGVSGFLQRAKAARAVMNGTLEARK
jgi:hypothetical protein